MFTTISYIGAHWSLILSVIVATGALGAFAWFTKNWKAALAAIVLVGAGLAYQSADLGGYKRRVDEEKAQEITLLRARIATLSLVSSLDNQRALSDAATNDKLDTLSRDTPQNNGVCLDADAARRVRAIGQGAVPRATPVPPKRHPSVLPWRGKRP